jgi:pantoate kinase
MNTATVTAFCPGHISGYFRRMQGDSLQVSGSIGAGIVISEGVTATVRPSKSGSVRIIRRGRDGADREVLSGSPLLSSVMERLNVTASVVTECRLPIGAGFGLSAAALLSTLTALDHLFGLGLTPREIALFAHVAEIHYKTGLGDVAACQGGGFAVRESAGIDGRIVRHFDIVDPLFAVSFGPILTPSVLSSAEQMERVSSAYPDRVPGDLHDFFPLCRSFDERSGLQTVEVRRALAACDRSGVPAAMTMLGNGVFACGSAAREVLAGCGEVYEFKVALAGARIIGETS